MVIGLYGIIYFEVARTLILCLTNDFIWWIPFSLYLSMLGPISFLRGFDLFVEYFFAYTKLRSLGQVAKAAAVPNCLQDAKETFRK